MNDNDLVKSASIGAPWQKKLNCFTSHVGEIRASNSTRKAGIEYTEGTGIWHGTRKVVFCKSGVGKVNAAVCTQLLIDAGVECVLFTGVAGAVAPSLNIGDIVISTACMQHDFDVRRSVSRGDKFRIRTYRSFRRIGELVELAGAASERLFPGRSLKGKVLSGDQFIAAASGPGSAMKSLAALVWRWKGAALAQVCAMNGVPYVVIRSMSDKADGSAHVNFAEFTVTASDQLVSRSLKICSNICKPPWLAGRYKRKGSRRSSQARNVRLPFRFS